MCSTACACGHRCSKRRARAPERPAAHGRRQRYAIGGRSAGSRPQLCGARFTRTTWRARRDALRTATWGGNAARSAALCPTMQAHVPWHGQLHSCGTLQTPPQSPSSAAISDNVAPRTAAWMVGTATPILGSRTTESQTIGVAAADADAAIALGMGHGLKPAVTRNATSDAATSQTAHGAAARRRARLRRPLANARRKAVGGKGTEYSPEAGN